jgi:hypothetical protein
MIKKEDEIVEPHGGCLAMVMEPVQAAHMNWFQIGSFLEDDRTAVGWG